MRTLWIVSYAVSLTACGSGGGDGQGKAIVGNLKGPSVEGLRYQAADAAPSTETLPTTDAAGRYEVSAISVKFFIGRLDLGSAPTGAVTTWSQLSGDDTQLANKALLVSLCDEDGDPSNGIRISPALTARALSWDINFSSPNFVAELSATIVPDIESVYGRRIEHLPTPQEALASATSAFQCASAGLYSGNWVQPPSRELENQLPPGYLPPGGLTPLSGNMLTLVTTPNGRVVGHQQLRPDILVNVLVSTTDLPMQKPPSFVWDLGHTLFDGNFVTFQKMNGSIRADPLPTGTMYGDRIAGSASAVQRFSKSFVAGGARYLLLIDVDANARPSATVVVNQNPPVNLQGSILGQQLELSSAAGEYRFDGPIQLDTNVATGTWTDTVNGTSRRFDNADPIVGCPP